MCIIFVVTSIWITSESDSFIATAGTPMILSCMAKVSSNESILTFNWAGESISYNENGIEQIIIRV